MSDYTFSRNPPSQSQSSPITKPSISCIDEEIENVDLTGTAKDPTLPLASAHPSATILNPPFTQLGGASGVVSHYASRSRATTPAALLGSYATARKTQSKQRFLDRIRTRRYEGFGRDDKVLRADYLRERKRWEQEMKSGAFVAGEMDYDEQMDLSFPAQANTNDLEDDQQSPVEEKEIEALLTLLEPESGTSRWQMLEQTEDVESSADDSQDWDELFLELASQQDPNDPLSHDRQQQQQVLSLRKDSGEVFASMLSDVNNDVEMS
jgi:hypothetical protein